MKVSVFIVVLFALVVPCQARLIIIDDDGIADFDNIQAAIDDANDADEVVLNPGLYTGPGNRDIDFRGKSITLRSTDPNDPSIVGTTVIDCEGTEFESHRAFHFHNGEDANSVVHGLTITNGYITQFEGKGGAILCSASSPLIRGCSITNSTVSNGNGGGICCEFNARPTIETCAIRNNYASINGGGIYLGPGNTSIKDCEIADNYAGFEAGGIFISSCAYINGCDISFNKGSGIVCDVGSTVEVAKCTIQGNILFEDSCGGGIVCRGAAVVGKSEIIGNIARSNWFRGSSGGGITCSGGTMSLDNCVVAGNRSLSGPGRFGEMTAGNGGGISCSGGSITANQCTIANNIAQVRGSAMYIEWGDMTLTNCIIWGNSPDEISGQTPSVTYSNVGESWTGTGNISIEPLFAATGYWTDGGTAQDVNDDFWIDGDYHLQSEAGRWNPVNQTWLKDSATSTCIDSGKPGCPVGQEAPTNGGRVNMGAYGQTSEASLSTENWYRLGDITNDLSVDYSDLQALASYWLGQDNCLPVDLNHDGSVTFDDFAILADSWKQRQ